MAKENNMIAQTKDTLSVKLLELYDSNKSYIDEAEKFLSIPSHTKQIDSHDCSLTEADIDRLYSHINVLENIAKLLSEEFMMKKGGDI